MIDERLIVETLGGPLPAFKFVGGELLVVSWDGERATVGAIKPTLVGLQETLDVRLDDGSSLLVSPDQVFLLQKERKRAEDLKAGDSLLAFYTRQQNGYLHYLDPGLWYKGALTSCDRKRWRSLSRLVAEHMLGRRLQPGESVRFGGHDRTDVRPENLKIVTQPVKQHRRRDPFGRVLAEAQKLIAAHVPPRNHRVASVEQGHCFAAGSKIFVVEGAFVTPMKIEAYAAEGLWKPILGYDEKKQLVRKVTVSNAWLTKKAAPVMKIGFSNGATLRVTPEHQVLLVDGTYTEAWKLKANDRVISAIAGFNMRDRSVLTCHSPGTLWVTVPPKPDQSQPYKVYDLTTETGNLIVDGVVCHNSTACLSIMGVTSDTFVAGGVFLATRPSGTAR